MWLFLTVPKCEILDLLNSRYFYAFPASEGCLPTAPYAASRRICSTQNCAAWTSLSYSSLCCPRRVWSTVACADPGRVCSVAPCAASGRTCPTSAYAVTGITYHISILQKPVLPCMCLFFSRLVCVSGHQQPKLGKVTSFING